MLSVRLSPRAKAPPEDIEKKIYSCTKGINFFPREDPLHAWFLDALATTFSNRYCFTHSKADLEESVRLHREALSLRPPGHSDRISSLNNFAACLGLRHQCEGLVDDIEEAIPLHREALALRPPGHPERSMLLDNLSLALVDRYECKGSVDDIDEVICLRK